MITIINSTYWDKFLSEYFGVLLSILFHPCLVTFIYNLSCVISAFASVVNIKTNSHNPSKRLTNLSVLVKGKFFIYGEGREHSNITWMNFRF